MSRQPIAAFLPAALDACALYRHFIPHMNIPKSRFVFTPGELALEHFCEADIAIVQRQVRVENYIALKTLKSAGMKLVYDLDDNLWNIPKYNPASQVFRADMIEAVSRCMDLCDIVTVSTRGLATAVKTGIPQLKIPVTIVPNYMDFKLFCPPKVRRDDRIVIGWGGSGTHSHDVEEAWSSLPGIVNKHENVYLELVNQVPPKQLEGHPRVKLRQWVPVAEYMTRFSSWAWDIVLAPLQVNRFNASKSNIKILEAAAVGAAFLGSDVQPYSEFCELGSPDLKWGLCSISTHWRDKLEELMNNADRRKHLAAETINVATKFYNITQGKDLWQWVFQQIAN